MWTVKTSTVDSNFKTGEFTAPNKVTMTREGGDVRADRASGNFNTSQATLYGHVVMHDEQGNFSALRGGAPSGPSRGPSTLTADQAHMDGKAKAYTASGNVHYTQADTTVDADKAILHDDTHDLYLEGNVHIMQGARALNADRVHYNTDTGHSHAEGNVTMQFPSSFNPTLATPRPINIKNPLSKRRRPRSRRLRAGGFAGVLADAVAPVARDGAEPSLFTSSGSDATPLAARMRPRTLDEFVGQEAIVGEGRALRLRHRKPIACRP